jgi:lipopolysaccharide export LptBFGC system permease protein LptF
MVRFVLALAALAGIGALIAFATLLGVQVTAQQQMTQAENHHLNSSSSNQSGISSTAEQQQHQNMTTTTTVVGGGMIMNQTSNINWINLVRGVKVSGISIIDNEHIAINLRYDGEGEPPGVSVVAVAIPNSSSDTITESMMQNSTTSAGNSSMRIMQSGSNYLEAGWQVQQQQNSATVLVQLDGEIAEGGQRIVVMVVPFLHH